MDENRPTCTLSIPTKHIMMNKSSRWAEIKSGLNVKILAIYGGIILLDHVFWDTIIIYPLKILTVFFHELSHALAAIVTGGKVLEIVLVPEQGGHCLIAGGNGFLVSSAGYLGSLIWGWNHSGECRKLQTRQADHDRLGCHPHCGFIHLD